MGLTSVATATSARGSGSSDGALSVAEDVFVSGAFLRFTIELHDSVGQQLALVRLDSDVPTARRARESGSDCQGPQAVKK
jgi:hypothetical protein